MLDQLNARQIAEWEAFFSLEPWGNEVEWYRVAMIATTIANVFRGKKGRSFKIEDFMPKHMVAKPKQSMEEMKAVVMGIYGWAKRKKLTKKEK